MAEKISVTIEGKDGLSRTFVAVADASTKAGASISKAGAEGARGMKQLGDESQRTASRMDSLKAEGVAIGAVMGTLAAGITMAGSAYQNQARQVDVINRLYGDQADVMLDLAEKIQDTTRYSNDAARQAITTFGSLQAQYGITTEQVENLVAASADLSAAFGTDLALTASDVSAAIRGEAEAIEKFGVSLMDSSLAAESARRGIEGWTTTMTESEKAAFRYTILMEQVGVYTGTAAERAENAGGTFRRFLNELQDGTQIIGGWLGPLGEIGAEMAPIAVAAPVVAGGLGKLSTGFRTSAIAATALKVALSPVTLALGALVGIGSLVVGSWMEQREAAQDYETALADLSGTMERVRRQGDEELAGQIDTVSDSIARMRSELEAYDDPSLLPDPADYRTDDPFDQSYRRALEEYEAAIGSVQDKAELAGPALAAFNAAMEDTTVDADAFAAWAIGLLESAAATETLTDDVDALNQIIATQQRMPAQFLIDTTAAQSQIEALKLSTLDFFDLFADMPKTLDDLRIGGEGALANDIEALHEQMIGAFTPSGQEVAAANASWLRMLPAEDAEAAIAGMTAQTELSEAKAESLGAAWDRITQAMTSGNLDNSALMADINAILADTTLSADQQADAIIALSTGMAGYVDVMSAVHEAQIAWLANGENILAWWREYDQAANTGLASMGESAEQMRALQEEADFRVTFDIAFDLDQANASFDQVLRIYDQIDSLSRRPAAALSVVDALFGEGGDPNDAIGPLRELYDAGRIGQEQFNDAVATGITIQGTYSEVQASLNKMRVDQLPLLEAEYLAYQDQLRALSELGPAEQRHALMLQDTAVQAQIADLYSKAYAATVGELPREVATEMIVSTAQADPALASVLEQMGLIREVVGPDGEMTYEVNFPGADASIRAMDRLTIAFLNMQAAASDQSAFDIAVEIYGEDEARELFGMIEENDGTRAETSVVATTEGRSDVEDLEAFMTEFTGFRYIAQVGAQTELAWAAVSDIVDALFEVDDTTATPTINGDNSGALGAITEAQGGLTDIDGRQVGTFVNGDASSALTAVGAAAGALAGIDGDSATVTINAINNAGSVIGNVAASLFRLDGSTATTYVNTVRTGAPYAHGGVAGYASGGVVISAAEVGAEIAHFPNGGMAVLREPGLYTVPEHTYISPHNTMDQRSFGGPTVSVSVNVAGHIIGVDDLAAEIIFKMADGLGKAFREQERSLGVRM